ncbi:hypothetical protein [Streptomyces sp. NPDC002573]|uniref:hypothetical protein n=1 Tax=Streptomyces sp. NPDC002573 TaxID=3364651 RepID=UPI0036C45A28
MTGSVREDVRNGKAERFNRVVDGLLRLALADEAFGHRNGDTHHSAVGQYLHWCGKWDEFRICLHRATAALRDVGSRKGLFVAVAAVAGELVVNVRQGFVGSSGVDKDAAEQTRDPIGVSAVPPRGRSTSAASSWRP